MLLPSAPLLAVRVKESEVVEKPSAMALAPVTEANWIEIECTHPYRVRCSFVVRITDKNSS